MAITAISPSISAEILPGASFAFTIDDTYTSLVIKVQTATALVNAYSTALGGGQSGYSVAVVDNGDGTHTVTTSADSGWDVTPQLIYVTEDETGSETTTNLSYDIIGESSFPQGQYPYNPTTEGAGSDTGEGATTGIGVWTHVVGSGPASGQVKVTGTFPASVTRLDFHETLEGSVTVSDLLVDNVETGDWLLIERATNPTGQYAYYKVTGDPSFSVDQTIFASLSYQGGLGTWAAGNSLAIKHIKAPAVGGDFYKGASWKFDTSETSTPATGKFSFDNDASPTEMYLHMQNQTVEDMSYAIEDWSGHNIILTSLVNSALQVAFTVGTPAKVGSVYTLPLTYDTGAGGMVDGHECYFDVLGVGTVSTTDELGGGIGYWMPITGMGPPAWNAPTTGCIGFDAVDMGSVTEIYIHEEHYQDAAGVKYSGVLDTLKTGDQIILTEKWDETEAAIYTLAADATFASNVIHLSSVTHEDSSLNSWPGVEMSLKIVRAAGAGDVVGPGSATDDAIAVYDGTTGKLLKDSTGTIAQIAANTAKNSGTNVALGTWTKGNDTIGATGADSFDVDNATIASITSIRILASNPLGGPRIDYFCDELQATGTLILQDISAPETNALVFDVTAHVLTGSVYWDFTVSTLVDHGTNWATSYSVQYIPDAGAGDVVGPASANNRGVPLYDGTTGKLLKDSVGMSYGGLQTNTLALTGGTGPALALYETGTAPTNTAAYGKHWAKNTAPTTPWFTDDVAGDYQLAYAPLSGAGAPGVATGDGYPIGTPYADTTADEGYILTDNTTGVNVWSTVTGAGGGGGFTDAPDGALFDERADHVNTPAAAKGELWLKDETIQRLMLTTDEGTDRQVITSDESTFTGFAFAYFESDGNLRDINTLTYTTGEVKNASSSGSYSAKERSTGPNAATGYGEWWVKNDAPTALCFTDDTDVDHYVQSSRGATTLGAAATTFAMVGKSMEVTGDGGGNTIATITGGTSGQVIVLQFVDALVTITDDNSHAADSVDLSAAFTSADDTILCLFYDGTSWYEISRSVN